MKQITPSAAITQAPRTRDTIRAPVSTVTASARTIVRPRSAKPAMIASAQTPPAVPAELIGPHTRIFRRTGSPMLLVIPDSTSHRTSQGGSTRN